MHVLQVGCGALGNGTSLPDAERLVANLRAGKGYHTGDRGRSPAGARRPVLRPPGGGGEPATAGQRREFDAAFMPRQLAGGVMTTLRRQLAELGVGSKLDNVMAEVAQVRAELGYPIIVTPFPQMVIGQALANVVGAGTRYDQVPDQVIRYVLSRPGKPTAPVEPDVLDRILSRPRAAELADEPPPLGVAELRRRLGTRGQADKELLLRFGTARAVRWTGLSPAAPRSRTTTRTPSRCCGYYGRAGQPPAAGELTVDKPGFRLTLKGGDRRPRDEAAARARLRDARGFILDMDGGLVLGDRVNTGWGRARRRGDAGLGARGRAAVRGVHQRDEPGAGAPRAGAARGGAGRARRGDGGAGEQRGRHVRQAGYRRVMVLGGPGLTEPLREAGSSRCRRQTAAGAADAAGGEHGVLVGWFPGVTMPALEAACDAVWGSGAL